MKLVLHDLVIVPVDDKGNARPFKINGKDYKSIEVRVGYFFCETSHEYDRNKIVFHARCRDYGVPLTDAASKKLDAIFTYELQSWVNEALLEEIKKECITETVAKLKADNEAMLEQCRQLADYLAKGEM
jgi:hypothetical protein